MVFKDGMWITSGCRVDKEKWGKLLTLESSTTLKQLKMMVLEDFRMDQGIVSAELSYFPSFLINNLGVVVYVIANDQQVNSFIRYTKKNFPSTCVCVVCWYNWESKQQIRSERSFMTQVMLDMICKGKLRRIWALSKRLILVSKAKPKK